MKGKGAIFDLDGTLADTLPDLTEAVNAGLSKVGLPAATLEEVRIWLGEGLPLLCERAARGRTDISIDEMIAGVAAHYKDHYLDQTRPFPGIPDLLDSLAERAIPIAVLTNKPHQATVPIVAKLFGSWHFTAVEGYRDEDRRKPDPRTAMEVAGRMGLEPGDVLMIGDSATDVETGRRAGMIPVGATWGYRDREELEQAGAAHLIDRPEQLLDLES